MKLYQDCYYHFILEAHFSDLLLKLYIILRMLPGEDMNVHIHFPGHIFVLVLLFQYIQYKNNYLSLRKVMKMNNKTRLSTERYKWDLIFIVL